MYDNLELWSGGVVVQTIIYIGIQEVM